MKKTKYIVRINLLQCDWSGDTAKYYFYVHKDQKEGQNLI